MRSGACVQELDRWSSSVPSRSVTRERVLLAEEEGWTSLTVVLEVWARERTGPYMHKVTEGCFTYVAVDDQGTPRPIGS